MSSDASGRRQLHICIGLGSLSPAYSPLVVETAIIIFMLGWLNKNPEIVIFQIQLAEKELCKKDVVMMIHTPHKISVVLTL